MSIARQFVVSSTKEFSDLVLNPDEALSKGLGPLVSRPLSKSGFDQTPPTREISPKIKKLTICALRFQQDVSFANTDPRSKIEFTKEEDLDTFCTQLSRAYIDPNRIQLTELECANLVISSAQAYKLFLAVRDNSLLVSLTLTRCQLKFGDTDNYFTQAGSNSADLGFFEGMKWLANLNLSDNNLGENTQGNRRFLKVLFQGDNKFTFINLQNNNLEGSGDNTQESCFKVITDGLSVGKIQTNRSLVGLDLSHNDSLDFLALKQLVESLKNNRRLACLRVISQAVINDVTLTPDLVHRGVPLDTNNTLIRIETGNSVCDKVLKEILEENIAAIQNLYRAVRDNNFNELNSLMQQGVSPFANLDADEPGVYPVALDSSERTMTVFNAIIEQQNNTSDAIDPIMANHHILVMRNQRHESPLGLILSKLAEAVPGTVEEKRLQELKNYVLKTLQRGQAVMFNSTRIENLNTKLSVYQAEINKIYDKMRSYQDGILSTWQNFEKDHKEALAELEAKLNRSMDSAFALKTDEIEALQKEQGDLLQAIKGLNERANDLEQATADLDAKLDLSDLLSGVKNYYKARIKINEDINKLGPKFYASSVTNPNLTLQAFHKILYSSFKAILSSLHLSQADILEVKAKKAAVRFEAGMGLLGSVISNGMSLAGELAPMPAPLSLLALPITATLKLIGHFGAKYIEKGATDERILQNDGIEKGIQDSLNELGLTLAVDEQFLLTLEQQFDLLALKLAYEFSFMLCSAQFQEELHAELALQYCVDLFGQQLCLIGKEAEKQAPESAFRKVLKREIDRLQETSDEVKAWLKKKFRNQGWAAKDFFLKTPLTYYSPESENWVEGSLWHTKVRAFHDNETVSLTRDSISSQRLYFDSTGKALAYAKLMGKVHMDTSIHLQYSDPSST